MLNSEKNTKNESTNDKKHKCNNSSIFVHLHKETKQKVNQQALNIVKQYNFSAVISFSKCVPNILDCIQLHASYFIQLHQYVIFQFCKFSFITLLASAISQLSLTVSKA